MSEVTQKLRVAEGSILSPGLATKGPAETEPGTVGQSLEEAVEYVLADCSFAVGQAVGMRMTVDYEAIIWWHDHFREKFLAAMHRHGQRWLLDRENVTGVGWMLGERAVRHAAGRDSIDVEAARRAAADVERHCQLSLRRAARVGEGDGGPSPRLAGYWCTGW